MKMRDGIYNITDRMVGVSSDEEGKTTEGLCRWRKGGGGGYTGKEIFNVDYDRNVSMEACILPQGSI